MHAAERRPVRLSLHAGEPVGAPALAADAVVEEEEALGIVFVLDRAKACVVLAPESLLPIRLEEVGLPHIGADARQEFADFIHRCVYGRRLSLRVRHVRFMPWNARIGGLSIGTADH